MDLLLACHVSQLGALNRSEKSETMEDAYFRSVTMRLPALRGAARLAIAVVLLAPLVSVLAYGLI